MTSTMSTRSSTCATASTGVAGLSATAASAPSVADRRRGCGAGARTPRRARSAARSRPRRSGRASSSGCSTIRWASNGHLDVGTTRAMTSGPKVRFGTNRPSITSHWMRSTPAFSRAGTPRRAGRSRRAAPTARSGSGGRWRSRPPVSHLCRRSTTSSTPRSAEACPSGWTKVLACSGEIFDPHRSGARISAATGPRLGSSEWQRLS